MATMTSGGDSGTTGPLTIAEHDKLGPLGGKPAVLESDSELRRALVAEFQAAAQAAREAAASVDHDVEEAVHDYRKALRRARAVLTLVSRALPRSERRAVKKALQEARRALGNARDHAVAPETLANLALSDEVRAVARGVLDAAAEAMPARTEIKQGLAEGAARALAQVEALEAALPATLNWSVVLRGVRETYDEARSARKAARRSVRSFHRWRRRSKELVYQLDVISGFAGMRVAEIQKEIEGATDPQSPVVDLIMLRDFVETHGTRGDALDHLIETIDGQIDDVKQGARRAGREAFRRKPRKFGKRLTRAIERDLAPVTEDGVS